MYMIKNLEYDLTYPVQIVVSASWLSLSKTEPVQL